MESSGSDDCTACVQAHQGPCTQSCVPFPFQKALDWFCTHSLAMV
jgi:hypothetical protein